MKRSACVASGLVVVTAVLLISVSSNVQAQQKTLTLNYSNMQPPNHKISLSAEEWCREIEKRTKGAVKITMFHGGTLTPGTQAYDGVVKGLSDIALSVFSYHRGRFPLTEFSDLPLGLKSCVTAGHLFNEYYARFKPKELEDTKLMYMHANPGSILHTVKKPVTKLDELKGLKIRVTPLGTKTVQALGAAAVAMPMGDTYDALSKNVVDGGFVPCEALEGWKLGEVVKFTTESWPVAFTSAWYVVMNKDKWNAISPENQKIIEKINAEWIDKMGRVWDEIDESGKAFSLKLGNKFVPLAQGEGERWVNAVQPVLADYVKMTKEKGLPGDQVLKFAQDYVRQHQK